MNEQELQQAINIILSIIANAKLTEGERLAGKQGVELLINTINKLMPKPEKKKPDIPPVPAAPKTKKTKGKKDG